MRSRRVRAVPIPESYWVDERLLAGEYPRTLDEAESRAKVARLHDAGVTSFVDLTEEGELLPYRELLAEGIRVKRLPIRDLDCPSASEMRAILDTIDEELARGETVYVHCWGGRGRTGTVVGCWLVRYGLTGEDALARIAELRQTPDALAGRHAPETGAQRRMVRGWSEGRCLI